MKIIKLIFTFILLINLTNSAEAQNKKRTKTPYLIEYATVTQEYSNPQRRVVKYFEEYGKKFREEYYDSDNKLYQVTACDGDSLRSVVIGAGVENMGVIRNPYFQSGREEAVKALDKDYKTLETLVVLGKECQQFQYHNAIINQDITIVSWNGIILRNSLQNSNVISIDAENRPKDIIYEITDIDK